MAGSLIGHFFPGLGFFLIGLWHLFNHIKLHLQTPKSFTIHPWFPTPKIKHLELFLIMIGSSSHMSTELFRHHRLDPDGTIPAPYLRNFEHASIGMSYILYTSSAIALDFVDSKAKYGLTQLLAAVALGQQLLMFRLHSADHGGLEGQYHLFVQLLTIVALTITLMAIGFPKSFILGFSRSVWILFLGIWLMGTGIMLWTPGFLPKGCSLLWDEGHREVRCRDETALRRAIGLINIEFSWYLIAIMILSVCFYLLLFEVYGEKTETSSRGEKVDGHDDDDLGLNLIGGELL